jgi:hypothetical protein
MGSINLTAYITHIQRKGLCWQIRCADGGSSICRASQRSQSEISEVAIQAPPN